MFPTRVGMNRSGTTRIRLIINVPHTRGDEPIAFDIFVDRLCVFPTRVGTTRGLYVFKHESELGNAHALFDRLKVQRKPGVDVPRSFSDYEVTVDGAGLPPGVAPIRRC